jgi:NADPH-dependent curcumin reductase CurA
MSDKSEGRINRQWLLKRRPTGMVSEEDFEYREAPMPEPDLAAGEILVRNLYLGFDPAMRGWMNDARSYIPPVPLGEPMRAVAVAEVIASENDAYPTGSLVQGLYGWQEYAVARPDDPMPPMALPEGTPPTMPLSILGMTSLTAYFGLLDVGQPKSGETVLVSGAAGATGSVVVQIAKIKGCRVVGIAGGEEKCRWLREACGADAVIDYRSENVEARLGELCPDGIDVFFDNVGGDILEAAIEHIADFGRIVLCGQIAAYNDAEPRPGPHNIMYLVARRVRMQGFIVMDYLDRMDEAMADLLSWVGEGKLAWREDIQEGFENIPATLLRLYDGRNQGKQLLKLADPSATG